MPAIFEVDFSPLASADPVALAMDGAFRPIHRIEIAQQALGIRRDTQHPLAHVASYDRKAFFFLFRNFFVRKYGSQLGAPVNRRIGNVGKPAIREKIGALFIGGGVPFFRTVVFDVPRQRAWQNSRPDYFDKADKLLYRASTIFFSIVIRIKKIQENPLCPLEIIGIGRVDFAGPIVAISE